MLPLIRSEINVEYIISAIFLLFFFCFLRACKTIKKFEFGA